MAESRKEEVEHAVREIKALYKQGRPPDRKKAHEREHGGDLVGKAAEQLGINPDTLRKARQFADRTSGYTRKELTELCRQVRELSPKAAGTPIFGRSHVIRIVSVPKAERAVLQEEAIAGGWGLARLQDEIALRFGARRKGGRRRKIPDSRDAVLAQVGKICDTWRRWLKAAEAPGRHESMASPMEGLPEAVTRQLRDVGKRINRLQKVVAGELKALHPGRRPRDEPDKNS